MIFEIYRQRRGLFRRTQWAWRLRAANGRILAVSGEGYNNRADCEHIVEQFRAGFTVNVPLRRLA